MSGKLNKTDHGLITLTDNTFGGVVEVGMLQCCHCGGQFPAKARDNATVVGLEEAAKMQRAGKTMRGWCQNCNGPICGPSCAACVPTEQLLENMEKGRPFDYRPCLGIVDNKMME